MEVGLYLYYRGAVTYKQLMEALIWQRKQRPTLGKIARRWGWLNPEEVLRILRGSELGRFGDRAIKMDLLTPFQVNTLLYFQRVNQQRLGNFFVEQKILSSGQMERLVQQLEEHNRRFRDHTPYWQARKTAV
jgi:hypothetical protein